MDRSSAFVMRAIWLCLIAMALGIPRADGSWVGPADLDPKTYPSPTGKYTLTVDPSERQGSGPATYKFLEDGKERWSATFPFTLREAGVTESGTIAGYAYSEGIIGKYDAPGDLLVIILDPEGKIRLKETTTRNRDGIRFVCDPTPSPVAKGLMMDEANDRVVVRVENLYSSQQQVWWAYRLSTATALEKSLPATLLPDRKPGKTIVDPRPVPGTPLTLAHYWRYDKSADGRELSGARFVLLDRKAKPVWTLDLPGDYSVAGDAIRESKLRDQIYTRGAILRSDQPGRFDLFFIAESKRVTFSVTQNPAGEWKVTEIARIPHVFAPLVEPKLKAMPEPVNVPERPFAYLGPLVLPMLQQIAGITVDGKRQIYAVDSRTGSIHVFDPAGKPHHICQTLPTDFSRAMRFPALAVDSQGEVYLGLKSRFAFENDKGQFLHFSSNGMRLESVVRPSGGFSIQPVTGHVVSSHFSDILLVDRSGKTIRTISRRPNNKWLGSSAEFSLAKDGSIAVLESVYEGFSRQVVHLYEPNGDPIRTIALPESAGKYPRMAYDGNRLLVLGEGGLIALDALGTPLQMSLPPQMTDPKKEYWQPLLVAEGREALLFRYGSPILHRYAMP